MTPLSSSGGTISGVPTMKFYMICNSGTLTRSMAAQAYPWHLMLAPVLLKDSLMLAKAAEMASAMKEHSQVADKYCIILDNGAYENNLISPNVYSELVSYIKPHCVVLPDLPDTDAITSRKHSMAFLQLSHGHKGQWIYTSQGKTKEQVLKEFEWAMLNLSPTQFTLGLGRCYRLWEDDFHREEDARFEMFQDIQASTQSPMTFQFHILGARWTASDRFDQPNVVGIDSFKPCHCALRHLIYPDQPGTKTTHTNKVTADDKWLRDNVEAFCMHYGAYNGFTQPICGS